MSGGLLPSRGAIFPALQAIGLPVEVVRRTWAALRYGAWEIDSLLADWEAYVLEQGQWQPNRYAGFSPIGVDLTPFWRPKLQNCQTQHYHPADGKALPAIPFGLIVRVGDVNGQRVALIRQIVRAASDDVGEKGLKTAVIQATAETLADDEMPIFDAGYLPKPAFDIERKFSYNLLWLPAT